MRVTAARLLTPGAERERLDVTVATCPPLKVSCVVQQSTDGSTDVSQHASGVGGCGAYKGMVQFIVA